MKAPEADIQQAINDPRLQLAIYTATGRVMDLRAKVVSDEALPDYQALREEANAIKKHTIENLAYYLEQLESNVVAHGGKVIYCRTGQEAADFVLDLAKQRGVHMLVKSKSMTSEEIHFNERLEEHQLEAVETDFGEYILQLAHQRPYHIVAPALHLTRYDVADIFTKELGIEREEVIENQTKIARNVLRQKFLEAGIGVSGANFLVADSGAVVIVENEGNARLSTSAPKIHIAIAGIEKVIPRAQDLAVFLNLLGRSATGQPLTVYTSFLSGPRRGARNRWPRRVLLAAAGQRPHQVAGRSGKAPVALLHPLRRMLESLPGVSQDRRPQLSVGLLGPHRRHHHAAVSRHDQRHLAALRLQPVRRLRRGLSGQDRYSEGVTQTARRGSGSPKKRGLGRLGAHRLPAFRLDRNSSPNLFVARDPGIDILSAGPAPRPAEEMGQPAQRA